MKKISIVIPVYNAEKYLEETISSILGQTYTEFEVIIVNDGSTDRSQAIIDKYARNDKRIKTIITENMGAPHARNTGLEASTGDYIIFFDADDVMLPNEVELLSARATEEDDLVMGSRIKVTETGSRYKENILREGIYDVRSDDIQYLMSLPPFPDNKMYSAKVIRENNIRFANVKMSQDVNFYLKYLAVINRVLVIREPVCLYREVKNSISHTYNLKILDLIKSLEDVREFAESHYAAESFFDALYNAIFRYVYRNLTKISFIKDYKTKERILLDYNAYAEQIYAICASRKHFDKKSYKKIKDIYRKKTIYLSKAYYNYICIKLFIKRHLKQINTKD